MNAIIRESVVDRRIPGTGMLPLRELMAVVPANVPVELEVPVKGLTGVEPDLEVASIMRMAAVEILSG